MACGNNMVSRSGLHSEPAPLSGPSGPGAVRTTPSPQQVAAVTRQVRSAMEHAEQEASAASTASAASAAAKDAQRALDVARRMRGSASERASLVRELERKVEHVKRVAANATHTYQQGEHVADRIRQEQELQPRFQTIDRLSTNLLGVPAHQAATRPPQSSRISPVAAAQRQVIAESLPLSIASDLTVDRVEQLSLDHPLGPSDLSPNTAYVYGENVYVTDAKGAPAYMHGVAKYVPDAPRHDSIQLQVGRDGQTAAGERFGKLVGGHIGAVSLGGYPSGPNLFAQNVNMNVSAFATFERQFRDLAKSGHRVEYSVRLAVDSTEDEVASVAILSYLIDDVDQGEYPLLNEPHQLR